MTDEQALCLRCDAARRDAADLMLMAAEDGVTSDRIHHLVSAMDNERAWRVALFMAGITTGLIDCLADELDMPSIELAHVLHKEMNESDEHFERDHE